jgi:hypothetical protein
MNIFVLIVKLSKESCPYRQLFLFLSYLNPVKYDNLREGLLEKYNNWRMQWLRQKAVLTIMTDNLIAL